MGCVPCGSLDQMLGKRVQVFGFVVAQRPHPGADGRTMCFITLEDGTGIAEATLFHQVYAACGGELQGRGPFLVRGVVEEQLGGVSLRVQELRGVAQDPG
jgi:DNA polymerase III alpha subunit